MILFIYNVFLFLVSPSTAAAIAQWSEWSVCSVTCGNGQKMRERDACPRFETQGCYLGECPSKYRSMVPTLLVMCLK